MEMMRFEHNVQGSEATKTYRNGNVVFLIASIQLPSEPDDSVSFVFVTRQQDVILRLIQHRLPIVAVNGNVTVLKGKKRKGE